MKVHLASVYEKILSSMGVNLSSSKVNLSSGKVNLSSGEVGSSGSKVNLSGMKVTFSRGLILKSIVCCACVMFSSDVSWGSIEEIINDDDITVKKLKKTTKKVGDKEFKVVFVGDDKVGKTQIINIEAYEGFGDKYEPTIGFNYATIGYHSETSKLKNYIDIQLKIWDTSGQKTQKNLISGLLTNVDAFVLVYDITKKESFENIQTWIELAKKNAPKDALYFLVGNKIDKGMENEELRQVSQEEAQNFAGDNNMTFFEVSAQTGDYIDNLFKAIVKKCVKKSLLEELKGNLPQDNNSSNIIDKLNNDYTDTSNHKKTTNTDNCCSCCPCYKDKMRS